MKEIKNGDSTSPSTDSPSTNVRKCKNCNKQLTILDIYSSFCSQYCFDNWYSQMELPALAISMIINVLQKKR